MPSRPASSVFYLFSVLAAVSLNTLLIFRTQAVGSGSMVSRGGSILAPFSIYLSSIWIFMPQVFNQFIGPYWDSREVDQLIAFCIFLFIGSKFIIQWWGFVEALLTAYQLISRVVAAVFLLVSCLPTTSELYFTTLPAREGPLLTSIMKLHLRKGELWSL